MKRMLLHLAAWLLLPYTVSSTSLMDDPKSYGLNLQKLLFGNESLLSHYLDFNAKRTKLMQDKFDADENVFGDPSYQCPTFLTKSLEVPTSVHALRPGDIRVIAAMGDSVTAAFGAGANGILELANEYRGMSLSVGGDEDVSSMITIANVIKKFNPSLVGASEKISPVWFEYFSQLNVAVSGSRVENLTEQSVELVRRLKGHVDIDFENDWKMINIFIGSNDLCKGCQEKVKYSLDWYSTHFTSVLDYLKQNIPRAFVNVLGNEHIDILATLYHPYCDTMHEMECPCLSDPSIESMTIAYQKETAKIVDSFRDDNETFIVVHHPWINDENLLPNTTEGEPDLSFFAPDCFHPSQFGHSYSARHWWNSLLTEEQQKFEPIDFQEPLRCPNEVGFAFSL